MIVFQSGNTIEFKKKYIYAVSDRLKSDFINASIDTLNAQTSSRDLRPKETEGRGRFLLTFADVCISFVLSASSPRHSNSVKRHIREMVDSIDRSVLASWRDGRRNDASVKNSRGNEFLVGLRLVCPKGNRRKSSNERKRKRRRRTLHVDDFRTTVYDGVRRCTTMYDVVHRN